MPAQSATLTSHQQRVLFPRARQAQGSFTAFIDGNSINIQTKTIVHDTSEGIFGITGRNAEGQDTVREFYIQIADDTAPGTDFDLSKGEFTKTRVWFSVKSPAGNFSVRAVSGNLSIQQISPQAMHIQGSSVSTSDTDPNGAAYTLILNFDLQT